MVKRELRCFMLLLAFCMLPLGCVANSQQGSTEKGVQAIAATPPTSKQELARAVLAETGTAKQYDLHLGNSVDIAASPETANNTKFMAWLQDFLVRQAGWKHVEAKYVAQLEANFSEAELKELLVLAKQPLMKKLMQAEMEAYTAATGERRKLLFKAWDDYNSGKFSPPPEVLK